MLSEFNKLENEIKGLSNVLTMCSADKISRYLKEVENDFPDIAEKYFDMKFENLNKFRVEK